MGATGAKSTLQQRVGPGHHLKRKGSNFHTISRYVFELFGLVLGTGVHGVVRLTVRLWLSDTLVPGGRQRTRGGVLPGIKERGLRQKMAHAKVLRQEYNLPEPCGKACRAVGL